MSAGGMLENGERMGTLSVLAISMLISDAVQPQPERLEPLRELASA